MLHVPSKRLASLLSEHGWNSESRDLHFLEECEVSLAREYRLTPTWREAVGRFGGFRLRWNGSKDVRAGAAIVVDPMAWRGMASDFDEYSEIVGVRVLPFAVVDVQEMPFAIGDGGEGYFFGPSILRWGNYLEGIESIVFGNNDGASVVEEHG